MTGESILLFLAVAAGSGSGPGLAVDHVFADHMVLQQGKDIPVRGSALPDAAISITFAGASVTTRADGNGRWTARLPALSGGTIGTLEIRTDRGERIAFTDIAVGEVWLCSGQSNMDLTVAETANPERTAREAAGQSIRLLKIKRTASASPGTSISADIPWSVANENNVSAFSAACWHMARSMRAGGITVPIGLVHAAWGGSTIEDWMSPDALRAAGVAEDDLTLLRDYAADPKAAVAKAIDRTDQWALEHDPGSARSQGWYAEKLDDSGWTTMPVPGQWERSGIAGLSSYDGVMWFRRTFDLSAEQAGMATTLNLGRIDERDRVWINGRPVGATLGTEIARSYSLPRGLLRPGGNTIAVRVIDEMGSGGFASPPSSLAVEGPSGALVALAGLWRYRTGSKDDQWAASPPFVPWAAPRGLGMAWNGMISPLSDFPLAGVVWYQGESNTARPLGYGKLLESWRADWRRQFDNATLPFVIVQLPGYGPRTSRPTDGGWAQLREVQRRVAAADANTGLAVTIDLGVSNDIHPAHKDIVGQRIATEAMRVAYGTTGPVAPTPAYAQRAANGVAVQFDGAGGGLITYGSSAPAAFEWCDAAKKCQFADARIDGSTVVVSAPPQATHIRYAWQPFPPVNLYGAGGLPVVPFEIPVS